MTGPLAGIPVPTSSRLAVATRSPSSGGAACGIVTSGAAAELKFAGYDGIIVSGQASSPTFVYVTDQRVTFERANMLWGKGAHEVERTIRQKKWTFMARTLTIGPAGENLVPYASMTADGRGQAGDLGIGAVIGSKNLKAVAVRGQAAVYVADLDGFLGLVQGAWGDGSLGDWRSWSDLPSSSEATAPDLGTRAPDVAMPAAGEYRGIEPLGRTLPEARLMSSSICSFCPLGRSRPVASTGVITSRGVHYCTTGALGAGRETGEVDKLAELSRLCDDLGPDTISAAAAIGFALDGTEGAVAESEPLAPDVESRESALRLLASGGDVGAGDIAAASAKEIQHAESRRGSPSGESAERLRSSAIMDSLILCNRWHPPLGTVAAVLAAITGSSSTPNSLLEAGDRILELERLAAATGSRHR